MNEPTSEPIDIKRRNRNRIMLLALIAVFLLPPVLAKLFIAQDWHPAHTTNKGELLEPAIALSDLALQRADGEPFQWNRAERRWQVIVVATADCGKTCAELIEGLDKIWQMQGRKADQFWVLWFGEVPQGTQTFHAFVPMRPDAELAARLPNISPSGAPTVYLVDPAGYAALRYPPGFDLSGLYKDVKQMLK